MKTNKLIPLILTAALALSACASAADSATTATAAETAAATPEPTAAPEPVGELRSTVHLSIFSNALYQTVFDGSTAQETTGTNVYKTDFSTGKTTLFYHADSLFSAFPFATEDTLYIVADKLLAFPLAGGAPREIPYDSDEWVDVLYDEQYLYSISSVTAPYAYTQGQRLDLQTGETLPWNIPGETTNVLDVVNGQLVTCRILSDSPVPFPEDSEMSDAFLQNSLCEFDLTDAVTGKPVQKLLSYPWYGEDDGTMRTSYYYLGHNGSDLYFSGYHTPYATDQHSVSVLCIRSDGTQDALDLAEDWNCSALDLDAELRWLMTYNSDMTAFTLYDLQGNRLGANARPAGLAVYTPLTLLDDGRVVLLIGKTSASTQLATIPADAFLSGSTEYTEMKFVG